MIHVDFPYTCICLCIDLLTFGPIAVLYLCIDPLTFGLLPALSYLNLGCLETYFTVLQISTDENIYHFYAFNGMQVYLVCDHTNLLLLG